MHDIAVVLGLLACVAALVPLADRFAVPYPILLVIGGLALGFIPNTILPDVVLQPDLVFYLFLPPLLYWTALTTPWREFRAYLRPILILAIGLVLATLAGVAAVARLAVPPLTWPLALVLGAIVSPPDAVATSAIADKLGLPLRVATILEGESLVNDAVALVAYGTTVAYATQAGISPGHTALDLLWEVVGGVGIGLLAGWLITWLRRRMNDPLLESTVSLLTPFAAYLPATLLGSSGVLATVTLGFVAQRYAPVMAGSRSRLQAESMWELVNFLLNGLVFILIGLQLHPIVVALAGDSLGHLIWEGAVVSLAAIAVRLFWVLLGGALWRRLDSAEAADTLPATETAAIAWAGMRGVLSIAAAQALPASFPQRNLILFLTFAVILATLVLQGLSLPALIRRLGLAGNDDEEREALRARVAATRAALAQLGTFEQDGAQADLVEDLRRHYAARLRLLTARLSGAAPASGSPEPDLRVLRRELVAVERRTLLDLRERKEINDETMRRIQRDLDLEELHLDPGVG